MSDATATVFRGHFMILSRSVSLPRLTGEAVDGVDAVQPPPPTLPLLGTFSATIDSHHFASEQHRLTQHVAYHPGQVPFRSSSGRLGTCPLVPNSPTLPLRSLSFLRLPVAELLTRAGQNKQCKHGLKQGDELTSVPWTGVTAT